MCRVNIKNPKFYTLAQNFAPLFNKLFKFQNKNICDNLFRVRKIKLKYFE